MILKKAKLAGLKAALRIVPIAQIATVFSALVISVIFCDIGRPRLLVAWCVLVAAVALFWIGMAVQDCRSDEITRKNPFLRHMIMAGLSSGLFGISTYMLFPLSTGLTSVFLGVFGFSLQLTGAFLLVTAPQVSLVWILVLGISTYCVLVREYNYQSFVMMFFETFFIGYVVYLVFRFSRFFRERFMSDEELRIYKRAIENTPASVVFTDMEGNISYVNPAFTEMTGYSPEEAIGQNPRILKSGLHNDQYYREMWETLTSGRAWCSEICNKKKDGSIFWESASISPIRDEKGLTTYYVAVKDNITDKKDMERLKEDVDRIMRHDLKQPLTAIIGLPQLLEMMGNLDEEQARIVRDIKEAGDRMLHMINLSLDMFKMETGKYEYHPQKVNAVAVASQVIEHNRTQLSAKRQECRLTINGGEPTPGENVPVWTEERLLYCMLSNLFTNAVEASPDSHPVLIDIADAESVCIAIHNRGSVPQTIRNCFFEKYKSFGKAHGTGLGTYSVKLLASAMHYEIRMETSDEEDKTCVSVHIPKEPRLSDRGCVDCP